MTITAQDLVRREVHYCVSSLVHTLATGYGSIDARSGRGAGAMIDLANLAEQAFELSTPIDDYEEAAREAGWKESTGSPGRMVRRVSQSEFDGSPADGRHRYADTWREACELSDIEPYQREVFEHWIVSDWLADKLAEKGEKVGKDFAGLTVWARTTTGQAIYLDSVIEEIHADLLKGE